MIINLISWFFLDSVENIPVISGTDTGNQVLTNKNSQIVKETKDYSQDGLQRYDICSVNFSENDTYVTAALKKLVKTTHQIKKGQAELQNFQRCKNS